MTQRVSAQPAWILHRREYRDSSLILDLLTAEHGCISLVARGGRKARESGLLQPFRPLRIDFFKRSELGTLGRFEADGAAPLLSGMRLWCGFYINELSLRLLARDDEVPQALPLYREIMQRLPQQLPASLLRHYEYQLLVLCGYALDAEHGDQGRPIAADARYVWEPLSGLQRHARGVSGQLLQALIASDWDCDVSASRGLLAAMLEPLLGGRRLRTADMVRELGALSASREA